MTDEELRELASRIAENPALDPRWERHAAGQLSDGEIESLLAAAAPSDAARLRAFYAPASAEEADRFAARVLAAGRMGPSPAGK